jgi:uncharacterized membrane protein YphA (DoxX/SURF4 family)
MKFSTLILWICRLVAAAILLQTLFYKFSASQESVYIFNQLGVEPWGRIWSGIFELIASILILIPRTSLYGALLAIGIMAGAVVSHFFVLGIEIMGDGGLLFIYALLVILCSSYIIWANRYKLFKQR